MSWNGLASNQMVNQDNAATSPFSLNPGQSHGSGTFCFTKDAALTKYNLNAGSMGGYASNQLVPKSTWVAGAPTSTIIYIYNNDPSFGTITNVLINGVSISPDSGYGFPVYGPSGFFVGSFTNGSTSSTIQVNTSISFDAPITINTSSYTECLITPGDAYFYFIDLSSTTYLNIVMGEQGTGCS
jgi:hypothetical protein